MTKLIKKIMGCLFVMSLLTISPILSEQCMAASWTEGSAMSNLDNVYKEANKKTKTETQNTNMDAITSNNTYVSSDSRHTLSNTIGFVIHNLHHYIQYVVYAGLVMATIYMIINGLQLVIAKKGDEQFGKFKKNIINTAIGIGLLLAFEFIIDVFVSLVNLIAE